MARHFPLIITYSTFSAPHNKAPECDLPFPLRFMALLL